MRVVDPLRLRTPSIPALALQRMPTRRDLPPLTATCSCLHQPIDALAHGLAQAFGFRAAGMAPPEHSTAPVSLRRRGPMHRTKKAARIAPGGFVSNGWFRISRSRRPARAA
jgi:hypothetical protein